MKIELPILPNFIIPKDSNGEFKEPIPISSFSDTQLIAIADLWRDELLKRASGMRTKIKTGGNFSGFQID